MRKAIPSNYLYSTLVEVKLQAAQQPYNLPPCQFRRRFSPDAVRQILSFLPEDVFSVSNNILRPKLRKAAKIWDVDKKEILFGIAFNHVSQSQRFFATLKKLADICSDWTRCSQELCNIANDRCSSYKEAQPTTRNTAGIVNKDMLSLISQLEPATNSEEVSEIENPRSRGAQKLNKEAEDHSEDQPENRSPVVFADDATENLSLPEAPEENTQIHSDILEAEPSELSLFATKSSPPAFDNDTQQQQFETSSTPPAEIVIRSPSRITEQSSPLLEPRIPTSPDYADIIADLDSFLSANSISETHPETTHMPFCSKRPRVSTEISPLVTPDDAKQLVDTNT